MAVVEEDIFADFEHAASPRLAAFDGLDRTIRFGSFSKSLWALVLRAAIIADIHVPSRLADRRRAEVGER